MGGQAKPGPIGTKTNTPEIDAGTSNRNQSHPPGPVGFPHPVPNFVTKSFPSVTVITAEQQANSTPLSFDELWNLVRNTRGFESSPSPFKKDEADWLRNSPATISWDPKGRGPDLGDPVETFG